jgi:calcium/calmodulin-dependent protein kinase I
VGDTDAKQVALKHVWLTGANATDHDLLPEIRAYCSKARLKRGIEMIKLANRIESLKSQEDTSQLSAEDEGDVPNSALEATGEALAKKDFSGNVPEHPKEGQKGRLSRIARGAIFREVVLAKVREEKEAAKQKELEANPHLAKEILGKK